MKEKILFSWIGQTDLNASNPEHQEKIGPIGTAVKKIQFEHIILLSNYNKKESESYIKWLQKELKPGSKINLHLIKLSSPTFYKEIYESVTSILTKEKAISENFEILLPGQ